MLGTLEYEEKINTDFIETMNQIPLLPQFNLQKKLFSSIANEELREHVEELKRLHVENIYNALHTIGVKVSLDEVANSFSVLKKPGETNIFLTITYNEKNYLIRINGKLWPPYTRAQENRALDSLQKISLKTSVLYNDGLYQICKSLNPTTSLEYILQHSDNKEISKTFKLVIIAILQYQNIQLSENDVIFPLSQMVADAKKMIHTKLKDSCPVILNNIIDICEKIINLMQEPLDKVFSHNDFLPSSIFVKLASKKVSIVDWEYSGLASRMNDLSMLACHLPDSSRSLLFNIYQRKNINRECKPHEQLEFDANIVVHSFLNLAWKINKNNLPQKTSEIDKLFMISQQCLTRTLNTKPKL